MDWLVREVRDAKDEVSHGDSGQKKQGREKAQLLCQSVKSEAMDNFCTRAEFSHRAARSIGFPGIAALVPGVWRGFPNSPARPARKLLSFF
jgi:hypothetical protein